MTHPRSRFSVMTAACMCVTMLAAGCGESTDAAAGGSGASPAAGDVTTKQAAIVAPGVAYSYLTGQHPDPNATDSSDENFTAFLQSLGALAKDASSIAGFVSGIVGGINAGITILQFLGILSQPPSEVAILTADVNAIGTGITWQALQSYVDAAYSPETVAIDFVEEDGAAYVADGSPDNVESANGVASLELPAAWTRSAIGSPNDSSTDKTFSLPIDPAGQNLALPVPTSMSWKQVVQPAVVPSNNVVFDWRLGAPFLLKGIALRLVVMNAVDPNFKTDHHFDAELSMIRNALISLYQTVNGGVQCGSLTYPYSAIAPRLFSLTPYSAYACAIVCADIYTGISALSTITPHSDFDQTSATCETNKGTEALADMMNATEVNVRQKLPLFQMQSMIDLLYTFLHPGPDLTQASHRISPQRSNPTLCIGTVGRGSANGTNLQLATCTSSDASQDWVYNRTTGQISNPLLGKCIDERFGESYGTAIGIWDCAVPQADPDSPAGPASQISNAAQQWTYDPSTGELRNALGVAMSWFINPISPGPAGVGSGIITDVAGQGGGFDVSAADFSSPTVNMGWMDNTIYDPAVPGGPATQCLVGGSTWMHCCPTGYAMTGSTPDWNVFKCAPLGNATGAVTLDTGTQRNGMHSCPFGQVMVGFRLDQNVLGCQALPANAVTSERVDSSTQDAYPLHACDATFPTGAISGIRADQKLLGCAITTQVQ
jgi:hypothetical protein